MKVIKRLFSLVVSLVLLSGFVQGARAQESPAQSSDIAPISQLTPPPQTYERATVIEIVEEQRLPQHETELYVQLVKVRLRNSGQEIEIPAGTEFQPLTAQQRLQIGKQVIVTTTMDIDGQEYYVISDVYRLPVLGFFLAGFLILVVVVAQWRGWWSIVGMVVSFGVLTNMIIPQILAGTNPFMVSLLGAVLISTITMYLSHGFNLKSHLSLVSLIITLLAVAILSQTAVKSAQLVGLGSEEAYFLQFGDTAQINLQGLLLAGIILGALGVLDDIVVAQVSVVAQLVAVSKKIEFDELYKRALDVGKDHVASLVNTLVLAYAGANLPLFILFYINQVVPMWVTINNELIAEEIVRTLVGSIGLVLAVPLTTLVASFAFLRTELKATDVADKHHGHSH